MTIRAFAGDTCEGERMPLPGHKAITAGLCVTLALLVAVPDASGSARDLERKRDEARRRQGEVRRELDLAQASETQMTRRLEEIGRELVGKKAEAESARVDAEQAAASVESIAAVISELRTRLERRRQVFNRRTAEAYMGGQGRPLDDLSMAGELLALPRDFSDAARRAALVSRVSHQDGDALGELAEARSKLSVQELALVLARDRAKTRAADADKALRAINGLKAEHEKTRSALQSRIAALTAEADALAAEQARLETLIRERLAQLAAARAARGRSPFASRRGTGTGVSAEGFIWPVQGYVTSGFGPRWGRMHTGIDVAAPGGTPIVAAKAGEVLYTGWLGGYGNLVALDHGDSLVTLYAHQSRIGVAEGQEVEQGQAVGFVGTTGHSTGNHLHFEVRIDTRPVDPRRYLP